MHLKLLIGTSILAVGLSSASAITMVGGINFQDNAFADSVISSSGTYTLAGASSLVAAVTGSSLNNYAYSTSTGAYIQLGFNDNYIVNGAGYDLALFEFGNASTFSLTIGGITKNYLSADTGYTSLIGSTSYKINVAKINLDDFNIPGETKVYSIKVGLDNKTNGVPAFGAAGAMNSGVPDGGSTIALLGVAFVSVALLKRKISRSLSS